MSILPTAPAPVIPVAPLPQVGGHMVPPDPVIREGPVPLTSPRVTPPDTSDDFHLLQSNSRSTLSSSQTTFVQVNCTTAKRTTNRAVA